MKITLNELQDFLSIRSDLDSLVNQIVNEVSDYNIDYKNLDEDYTILNWFPRKEDIRVHIKQMFGTPKDIIMIFPLSYMTLETTERVQDIREKSKTKEEERLRIESNKRKVEEKKKYDSEYKKFSNFMRRYKQEELKSCTQEKI